MQPGSDSSGSSLCLLSQGAIRSGTVNPWRLTVECAGTFESMDVSVEWPGIVTATAPNMDDALSEEPMMTQPEVVRIGKLEVRYLIDGAAHQGMGLFELTVPPGSNVPPPHSHTRNEECVYVLEGTLRYSVDELTRDLRPGDWMRTPKGSVHGFSNPHEGKARALIALTPDIGAQYFRDVASIVNAGEPPDRTQLLAVMARYGLVPAPQRA